MTWNEDAARFKQHLRAQGSSPGHLANVRGVLRRFGEHTGGKAWSALKKDDVEGWLADLRGQGLSDSSVGGYLTIMKAALRDLNEGETPACLKGLRANVRDSRVKTKGELLSEDEFRRLLNVMPPPKALIFRLLWDTGARPGEILGLRRVDLSFDRAEGRDFVELSFRDTKTKEPREVPVVNGETITALRTHLETAEDGWLFPSPRLPDAPIRPQGLWRYLQRAARRAGLKKRVYPYLFRHTAATRRYDAPAGIRDQLMGWRSDMAKNYEHLANEDVRDYLLETEGPPASGMTDEEAMSLLTRLALAVKENPSLAAKLQDLVKAED